MAFELTGNPLNDISAPIEELSESFNSTLVFDFGNGVGITQYTFWMIIICAIVLVGVLVGVRKIKVVPEGKFAGLVEWGYDAVRRNMGEGAIGHGYKKHIPFIATMFFFILISNVIGLIPGAKTPTGTLSVTFANPAGVAAIAWAVFLIAMYALECLVAFLQAYVFSVLTAVYVGLAQSEH